MVDLYMLADAWILIVNASVLLGALSQILFNAGFSGLIGVLMVAFQRAAFSNKAG